MKIVIATHKDKSFLNNSIFTPIQVGKALKDYTIDDSYYSDDSAENISNKNSFYAELTALYWLWKNLPSEDILGLMHYRRYFNFLNYSLFKPHRIKNIKSDDKLITEHNKQHQKIEHRVRKWLNSYDIILPYARQLKLDKNYISVQDEYIHSHIREHWDTTLKIIIDHFPEYKESIHSYFESSNEIYILNMFVAKRDWLDSYCKWLFTILFEVEKQISIPDDPYQKRALGFLSERLLTLYVRHNQSKIKQLPLLFIENYF